MTDLTLARGTINAAAPRASSVSLLRLYLLRAGYLLLVIGLGVTVWPDILHHARWGLMQGVVSCMLGAIALLAVIGLHHPLRMLPLLVFEMVWKSIWLLVVALPLFRAQQLDEQTMGVVTACLMVVIFPIVMPWRYLLRTYFFSQGERWY